LPTDLDLDAARSAARALPDLRPHFSSFLESDPERLHFCAHSHHPWPDVTRSAHARAWADAAQHIDAKWDGIFAQLLPRVQRGIAEHLQLSDPSRIAFAPNTHELIARLFTSLDASSQRPARILTSDAEFHSCSRQFSRWEEAGLALVERVPAQPYADYHERLGAAISRGGHDLVLFSHVHFDSGYVTPDLAALVEAVPDERSLVVIDGYHGFLALPTDLAPIEARAFYLAGGYKYAMSGEGACFMHCPDGYAERPVDTGWFAAFGDLAEPPSPGAVPYSKGGWRLWGATFDPSPLYRMAAVFDWLDELELDARSIHARVRTLQHALPAELGASDRSELSEATLVPGPEAPDRGHFLTFASSEAGALQGWLAERKIVTDHRAERLRFGVGLYHSHEEIEALGLRLRS